MTEDNLHVSLRPPYLMYDIGSVLIPVPEDALNFWTERIKSLLERHKKPNEIDLWGNVC